MPLFCSDFTVCRFRACLPRLASAVSPDCLPQAARPETRPSRAHPRRHESHSHPPGDAEPAGRGGLRGGRAGASVSPGRPAHQDRPRFRQLPGHLAARGHVPVQARAALRSLPRVQWCRGGGRPARGPEPALEAPPPPATRHPRLRLRRALYHRWLCTGAARRGPAVFARREPGAARAQLARGVRVQGQLCDQLARARGPGQDQGGGVGARERSCRGRGLRGRADRKVLQLHGRRDVRVGGEDGGVQAAGGRLRFRLLGGPGLGGQGQGAHRQGGQEVPRSRRVLRHRRPARGRPQVLRPPLARHARRLHRPHPADPRARAHQHPPRQADQRAPRDPGRHVRAVPRVVGARDRGRREAVCEPAQAQAAGVWEEVQGAGQGRGGAGGSGVEEVVRQGRHRRCRGSQQRGCEVVGAFNR